jgi:TRAP-type C4-dicarboxylate transport system permease small subunit
MLRQARQDGDMKKIWSYFLSATVVLASLILIFITLGIGLTIFLRFVKITMPGWIVQFAEYGLLWMPLLGAAWLLQKDQHVNVDLLVSRLNRRNRSVLNLVHAVLGVGVCGILSWYSIVVVWEHYQRKIMDIQVVDMPQYAILIVLPAGFLMLLVQFLIKLADGLSEMKAEPSKEQSNS